MDEKFKWYDFMYYFIDNFGMKEKEILKENYINLLNWLSYLKHKNEISNPNSL